jgi:hypothetical protein
VSRAGGAEETAGSFDCLEAQVIKRRPRKPIRDLLKAEVGYGCPVPECGSPYLSWHHFDPPWAIEHHENPKGIIPLCLQHHKEADHGTFTKAQLRELKARPYMKSTNAPIAGRFHWRRDQVLLLAGGNWYLNCEVIIRMRDSNIIWLSKDDNGAELINLDLYGPGGELLFSMRDNDWAITASLKELECPPSAKSLMLKEERQGINVALNFREVSPEYLKNKIDELMAEGLKLSLASVKKGIKDRSMSRDRLEETEAIWRRGAEIGREQTYQTIRAALPTGPVTICIVTAKLVWPFKATLHERYSEWPNSNLSIGDFSSSAEVAVLID